MQPFGIVEFISLLLGLGNFGIHQDPKPPTADAALEYAVADADVVVEVDAQALIPGNYKALLDLQQQPQIKASADLSAVIRKVIGEVEGGRGLAKQATGIDPTTDINDATLFVQVPPQGEPHFLAAVHGAFTTTNVDKIAASANKKATAAGAGAWVEMDPKTSIGVTKDHVLLIGTTAFVRDRMAPAWKSPSHAAGTTLAYAAAAIDAKPVFTTVLTLSANARKQVAKEFPSANFITDLAARHKAASIALYADGLGWTWTDSSRAGLDSMVMISDGVVDTLRAAQIAPRGIAKIAIGGLESYKSNAQVAELLRHKDDLMKIVGMYSGDGSFKVKVDTDPAKFSLSVRATGKTASEVVPLGAVIPFGVLGFLMTSMRDAAAMTPMPSQVAVPPAPAHPAPAPTGKHP